MYRVIQHKQMVNTETEPYQVSKSLLGRKGPRSIESSLKRMRDFANFSEAGQQLQNEE